MKIQNLITCFMLCSVLACQQVKPPSETVQGEETVVFQTSDSSLNNAFTWAKNKALSYAHEGDPVGSWYEAALPNREAFCMRDVAHQSTGAAVLGLQKHNLNMLHKFAENISESKDYCSFWEINRYDEPAPVDYKNDHDFWYNLPANFDVMQACYQQFLWTGDSTYINDPVFMNFYQLSVHDYVDRWQLGVDEVLHRDRLINIRYPNNPDSSYFYDKRGIPTYNEGGRGRTLLGIDMTASLFSAYKSYAGILKVKGLDSLSVQYNSKAEEIRSFLNDYWWDADKQSYRSILYDDGSFDYFKVGDNQAFLIYLLHFNAMNNADKLKLILSSYDVYKDSLIVELASYLPKYFFQYGYSAPAIDLIKKLSNPNNTRRDYPENSFAIIDAITTGLMGIQPNASENMIATISNLNEEIEWAEMDQVPVFSGSISIAHEAKRSSTLTNETNKKIIWKACFYGNFMQLHVDKIEQPAKHETDLVGRSISFVLCEIEPGETFTIKIPTNHGSNK